MKNYFGKTVRKITSVLVYLRRLLQKHGKSNAFINNYQAYAASNDHQNKVISFLAAAVVMIISVIVIIGWFTHNTLLKSIIPGTNGMKLNVALGFVFSSAVLIMYYFRVTNITWYRLSVLLSCIVFFIGLLTFAEYFFGCNFGIDELFIKDDTARVSTYYAGRMSPLSALNLLLIGIGLLLMNNEKTATYQFFYLSGIAFISLLMLISFNFIADIPTFINLSIYDAAGFIILSTAIYFAQPMLQKKITFEQKLFTNFSAIFILITVLSIFSSYYSDKRISTSQGIKHTNDVLNETGQILTSTKDMEGDCSIYVITGDLDYLQYFTIARDNLFSHVKKLKELTKDNPLQQLNIDSLAVLTNKRVGFSLQSIQAKNGKDFELAKELIHTAQVRLCTEAFNIKISEIQIQENQLLIQRQKESRKNIVSFNRAFYVLLGSIFILLVFIIFSIRHNIALRKRAMVKIKESEHMFSTLFYQSPVLKAIIDKSTGEYIQINDAFVHFLEDNKENIAGKKLDDMNMPGNFSESSQVIKNISQNGFVRELEMQIDSRQGKSSWVSANVDLINLNGKDCFLFAGIDITKRKIAEENLLTLSQELEALVVERTQELDRSEKSYRHLFENNPMPMWILDLVTFKFLDINEIAIQQYGYSRQEFLSMTAFDIRPDEEKELFKYADHSIELGSTDYNRGIWNHKKKDGTVIQVEIIAHEIIFEGLQSKLILANDITERKRAEEKLVASEKQFRYTLDSMLEGAQIIGFDWRYKYVNDSMTKHGKYSREELIGYTVMEKYPGIEATEVYKGYERCFNDRVAIHQENEFIFPDKTSGWFELSFQPVEEGIFILSIDVTERKKAQFEIEKLNEELEQKVVDRTHQLEVANKELEAFSYSVSHDLRTPLRAINGFSKKLRENYGAAFDNEENRLFNRIEANAIKMGLLIDDLLEFSRLGRKEIHKSPIQMTELAQTSLMEISTNINHGAVVKIHQLHAANADSTMIKQVMINLISNAIKYSSKTENPSIVIKSHLAENEVIYSVTDNGVGFNNQFVDKLFGVFQRLHLQTDFEGTGVGLALVKRIISKHGGRVWANGEMNKGATFCFSLPATTNN